MFRHFLNVCAVLVISAGLAQAQVPSVADMVKNAVPAPGAAAPAAPGSAPAVTTPAPAPAAPASPPIATAPVTPTASQEPSIPSPPYVETLPIEVALMYSKLIKEEPNLDFLVFANPVFRSDPSKFSEPEAVKAQRDALDKIYKGFTADTLFFAEKDKIKAEALSDEPGVIKIRGLEPDQPIVYELTDSARYGVFLRNATETLRVTGPYEKEDIGALMTLSDEERAKLVVELTLKPIAADQEPYRMEDDTEVKLLLANIVELKLFTADKDKLLLQKRFKNWKPLPPPKKEEQLLNPDALLPAPQTP